MARIRQDFELWQGETKAVYIQVFDDENNFYNITDASVRWKMQMQIYNGQQVVLEKSTSDGITIPDPLRGLIRIDLQPEDTENMPAGFYYHEAELMESSGAISVITIGRVQLHPSINK